MSRDIAESQGIPKWSHSVIGLSDSPRLFQPRNPNFKLPSLVTGLVLCLASWKLEGRDARFGLTVNTMDGPENFVFYFPVGTWENLVDPYEHGYLEFVRSEKYSKRIPPGMTKSYRTVYTRQVQEWDGQ
jgi:hypothetical protein